MVIVSICLKRVDQFPWKSLWKYTVIYNTTIHIIVQEPNYMYYVNRERIYHVYAVKRWRQFLPIGDCWKMDIVHSFAFAVFYSSTVLNNVNPLKKK